MVCSTCPAKQKCCPKVDARSVTRERFEEVREFAGQCTASEFNPKAQARRKKVEMLFAHFKRILGLGRLRLRGPCGVQDEFTLAAAAQKPSETGQAQATGALHRIKRRTSHQRPKEIKAMAGHSGQYRATFSTESAGCSHLPFGRKAPFGWLTNTRSLLVFLESTSLPHH